MSGEKHISLNKAQVAVLSVRVHPRARKNQLTAILTDGTVKISLTAPPVEGKANQALITFLSQILQIPKDQLTIMAGASGRNKLVSVSGITSSELLARLDIYLQMNS